jgi:hypothetical protein
MDTVTLIDRVQLEEYSLFQFLTPAFLDLNAGFIITYPSLTFAGVLWLNRGFFKA